MKVSNAYPSFKSLWESLPEKVRNIKNATYNPCGDIYQPKPDIINEFDPEQYYPPIEGHPHHEDEKDNEWHNDINYSANNKRPALLVGDPNLSFLWFRPIIFYKNSSRFRTRKFVDVQEFIKYLEREIS